jgi:hypothetical protein
MKSNTPWLPGVLPVSRVIQAGGVNGLGVDMSLALDPPWTNSRRKGIVPSSINGSRIVNVAPSRPISRVGCIMFSFVQLVVYAI